MFFVWQGSNGDFVAADYSEEDAEDGDLFSDNPRWNTMWIGKACDQIKLIQDWTENCVGILEQSMGAIGTEWE